MRLLFINPANVPANEPGLLIEPIDVLSLATFARVLGHEVTVSDFDRAGRNLPEDLRKEYDMWVIPFDYQTPLFSEAAVPELVRLARAGADRGARVVLGGRPVSACPEQFLVHPAVVLAAGEMEGPIEDLLKVKEWGPVGWKRIASLIYLDKGCLVRTPARGSYVLDTLPIPDRSLVDLSRYIDVRTLLSSRGCVGRCTFCPVTPYWGAWRGRDPSLVADEIEYLVKDCGGKKLLLIDDNCMGDPERMGQIADEIIRRRIKCALGGLGRINSFRENIFKRMHQAGFRWIHFGVESGSNEILSRFKKGITVSQAKETVKKTLQLGFRVRTSWIIDPPGCDERSIAETVNLILETKSHEIRIHYFTLRPRSEMAGEAKGSGGRGGYIHHADCRWDHPEEVKRALKVQLKRLLSKLEDSGYDVVTNPEKWEEIAGREGKSKFVSFCPSRYGIGWEL